MNRKIKGLLLTVCVLLGIFGLTGCTSVTTPTDNVKTLTEDVVAACKSNSSQLIQQVAEMDDATIEQYLAQTTEAFTVSALESWKSSKEELGTFAEITAQGVEEKGNELIVTSSVVFEKAPATVTIIFEKTGAPTSMSFDVNYTFAQTMEKAALNTIMGIGIVFCMLLFLSILISQFKHVAKLEAKLTKKEAPAAPAAPAPVAAPVEEEELVDDGELIAVIAAAIAASENTSTDSFTVRSIRKSNANKWKRA